MDFLNFLKELTIIDGFTIILSLAAVIISVISIKNDNTNLKKELRISKIEELIELIINIKYDYDSIYTLYLYSKSIREATGVNTIKANEIYKKYLGHLEDSLPYLEATKTATRLQILANSYLPNNKLKKDIYCVYDLFWKITADAYKRNSVGTQTAYPEGCPNYITFSKICDVIERDLIVEMGLGYEGAEWDDLKEYRNNNFKKKLSKFASETDA